MLIKLCGFTNLKTTLQAIEAGVNFIGFVFCSSSPRNIDPKQAEQIALSIPPHIKKVAVIVDAKNDKISEIIKHLQPDFLQIHSTNKQRITEIKNHFNIPIIKSFSVATTKDLEVVMDYESVADLFLFDTKNDQIGGSGESFDWRIINNLNTKKNWFLSGGLNINNVKDALKISGAKMIDLSSGIEEVRGVKSLRLIKEFMNFAKNL
jgi:phosphoribosylanthranilate isomerase